MNRRVRVVVEIDVLDDAIPWMRAGSAAIEGARGGVGALGTFARVIGATAHDATELPALVAEPPQRGVHAQRHGQCCAGHAVRGGCACPCHLEAAPQPRAGRAVH